jgi:hypothetical protein
MSAIKIFDLFAPAKPRRRTYLCIAREIMEGSMVSEFFSSGIAALHPVGNSVAAGLALFCVVSAFSVPAEAARAYGGGPVARLIVDGSGSRLDRTLSSDVVDCVGSGLAKIRSMGASFGELRLSCVDRGNELGTISFRDGRIVGGTGLLAGPASRAMDGEAR